VTRPLATGRSIATMPTGELNPWWRFALPVVGPLLRLLFRVRVTGIEHVPARGPTLLAFNHLSSLDGPILAIAYARRVKRPVRFLVAAEFFGRRFHGWVLRTFDQIPIKRGESDAAALDAALQALREGSVVAIAPEGEVNARPETLERIRGGFARLALPTGAPVVPVGVWGTQDRWPRSGLRWGPPWRPTLAIAFGPPMLPDGDAASDDDIEELKVRLGDRLADQVAIARTVAAAP
jgi:1-acyl-sn-glycerol-3-phosphate acyltransferase